MGLRRVGLVVLTFALAISFLSCGTHKLESLTVNPNSVTAAVAQSVQFHADASYVLESSKPRNPSTQDVTTQVSWASSDPNVATIDRSGIAHAVAVGSTTISATLSGVKASATLSVAGPGGTGNLGSLSGITILPNSQTTLVLGEPAQYIAIGTFSSGSQDITDLVKWSSSDQSVATISQSGLALSVGAGGGQATIIALGTASDGSVMSGTATFTACKATDPCGPTTGVNLPALSVFEVGLGAGSVQGFDEANPTVMVINCDPSTGSSAGCSGYFPLNATVKLIATPDANSTFGGWSANCTVNGNTCSIKMSNNEPVGAIFN